MQRKRIYDLSLYHFRNAMESHNGKQDTYYENMIGNVYMCSLSTSESRVPTLVIELQEDNLENKLFGLERFKLDSNEQVDSEVTLATFIAKSGNGYQAYHYDGFTPSDIIHLSVVAYNEELFEVI